MGSGEAGVVRQWVPQLGLAHRCKAPGMTHAQGKHDGEQTMAMSMQGRGSKQATQKGGHISPCRWPS